MGKGIAIENFLIVACMAAIILLVAYILFYFVGSSIGAAEAAKEPLELLRMHGL